MPLKHLLGTLFLCLFSMSIALAQKHTISGTIKEQETGETLIGVNVIIGNGSSGTITNEYGFYSITLPQDTVLVTFSYIGLQPKIFKFYLDSARTINLELGTGINVEEVTVSANSNREKLNSTQMGMDEITVKEAKEIPAFLGEVDIIKIFQLKPGIQSGTEGSSGLYVRGGGSDQNLFILDEAPVYNPSHLFGFFSTFNSDALSNVKLYKSGFPAKYGGKLSSVIDVYMREGNRKKFALTGGLGLISSRLTFEGPLGSSLQIKNKESKGAFILSGRRTYVDLFTRLMNEANKNNENWSPIPDYSFYDINVKLNYDLGSKDRIFLSGYFGRDLFGFNNDNLNFNFEWGNITGTFRWNHIISPKLFVNTAFTFSDYLYDIKNTFDDFKITLGSGIRDMNLKSEFMWKPLDKHDIRFGVNGIYHRFKVNRFQASSDDNSVDFDEGSFYHAGEFAAYISDDWQISKKLTVNGGIRLSGFTNEGQFYAGAEPRAAVKYNVHEDVALKVNYARMYQYLHLVSTSGASLPTDVWYPSTKVVKPQISDLVSGGVAWALGKDFFISVEGYYKWLHQQIDFRDGAQLFVNDNLDAEFVFGKGYGYGGEFYIEKKMGDIRGWIGYTLSWTWREFPDIMNGKAYHPRYDRRHDVSAVLMWDLPTGPKFPLTLSAAFVYGTGNAISLPVGRYISSDITGANPFNFTPIYTERNGFRMPAYHRLDIGLVWKLFPLKESRFKSDLTFSVFNVYNRRNPFFMYIDAEYDEPGSQIPSNLQAKVVSLFPIIPSITWNFKFN